MTTAEIGGHGSYKSRLAWARIGLCLVLGLLLPIGAWGQGRTPHQPADLLHVWFAFPASDTVAWPYAYIRVRGEAAQQRDRRKDLFSEFRRLLWRLDDDGHTRLAAAVREWQQTLAGIQTYREPGTWSPDWLLANPNQNPPLSHLAAAGACVVPSWVEVWDARGVHHVPWTSGLKLSDLEDREPALRQGSGDEISVVDPQGAIDRYGVRAFNYADTPLAPGARVIATLPLKGAAFPWIRDTIATLLAHTPSGVDCREVRLAQVNSND